MLIRDDVTSRAAPEPENISDAVAHFVVSFVRVIRTLQLYPSDHKFVREGFDELALHLKTLLGLRERVTFGFRDDAVLFDDQVLLRGHPTVASLRHHLEEKNIESFTVDREVELFELRSLADVLAKHRLDVMKDGRIDDRFLSGLRSIRLNEVSYRRIKPGEDPDAAPPPESRTAPESPFLALDDPTRHAGLAGLIAQDPGALSTAFGDWLRRTVEGFSDPHANVEPEFLAILERTAMAVLAEAGTDLGAMRHRLAGLLQPLSGDLVNRGLRKLVVSEMGYDVGRVLSRFSAPARVRMLLTEAFCHGSEDERMMRALESLAPTPDRAREILTGARAVLEKSTLTGGKRQALEGCLDRLDRERSDSRIHRGLVVLAEKDARAAGVTRILLERAGFDVMPCEDGTTALETTLSARPALVVMDPTLSGVHGLEILARLKRIRPCIPVVFTSAHDAFRTDFAVSTYPKLCFVAKPVGHDELVVAVENLLAESERPSGPLGPDAAFEQVPAAGPTFGLLRTPGIEVGVCARGRFRDTFFRVLPRDAHRAGVFVAEREAGPVDESDVFRRLGATFETGADNLGRPSDWVRAADRTLRDAGTPGILLSGLGVEIDGETHALTAARAGYNSPLVTTPGGAPAELHLPFGPLLGASHTGDFEGKLRETRIPFPPGASLLLASEGAMEAIGKADADLATRLFAGFLGEHALRPLPEAMEAMMGLLGGLGVRGPGADLQVLLVRRR